MAGEHDSVDDLMHPQRFSTWSNQNMGFQSVISKQLQIQQATADTHSVAKGGSYDMVSMEMDETTGGTGGGDLYAVHGLTQAGRGTMQTSAGMPSSHSHSVMMSNFMHGHTNLPKSLNNRKFSCRMCSQVLESKAEFQLHNQSHMREPKPYRCSQCIKSFANSSYLSQHMRIHLGIKPYHCEVCKKKFTQLSHLQQHIRTHTGDKPYRCPHLTCTKAFSQLSNLQSHSRCHQQDKPFKCNSCYKCFYDEQSLLEHIPKHKDSKHLKTHICVYCGKSYTQETYLQRHMAKHSDKADKQNRMALSHVKTSGDISWPKQELVEANHRFSQEDLFINYNQYPQYTAGYGTAHHAHHAINPYNSQTSPINYDTSAKSSGSAFSLLSGGPGRNTLAYYSDPFSVAMKTQNGAGLSEIMTGKNGQISAADHFASFTTNSQVMRNHHFTTGFANSMPTMLPGDGSALRRDTNKTARY